MQYKLITTIIACLMAVYSAFAQNGAIRGQIIDGATGEPLIGATALIEGTTQGAATDLDGNYSIEGIAPGNYTVLYSYISYQTQKVQNATVAAGPATVLNIKLQPESIGLQEVVVEAQAIRNSESALLTTQKKASLVLDGISAQQISRNNDNDAAAAISRVTGVAVEAGKYVYVRGLGDRYSKTALNNAEIPGLDPNKNSVQMDLFPSNLLDNIVVYKTFSPELPASFTGGYVNVTTKEFPERFTFQASGSLGYNTNATFNDQFLAQEPGRSAYLGIDGGRRDIPGAVSDGVPNFSEGLSNPQVAQQVDRVAKSFTREMAPKQETPFLNHRYSFAVGGQTNVFGKPLGLIGGVTYQRNYEYYDDGTVGRYTLSGVAGQPLVVNYDLSDRRGSDNVLWGGLFNATIKLSSKNKVGINLLHNQSSETNTRILEGLYPVNAGGSPNERYQTRVLQYLQRSLTSLQLKGDHAFGGSNPVRVDWISSYTLSTQDEPDLRFFTNSYSLVGEQDTIYQLLPSRYPRPTRYFRFLEEYNFDNKLNVTIPFKQWNGLAAKIKVGGAYVVKEREFRESIYEYFEGGNQEAFNGNVQQYVSESNLGLVGQTAGGRNQFALTFRDISILQNDYNGDENVLAGYAMVDLPFNARLRATLGARYERTDIDLESLELALSEDQRKADLQRNDILPAVNITYEVIENMNIRAAYGRTLARPTFRELAPFTSFDFIGDFLLVGNPNLQRTLVDNFDLRWEFYPASEEILSVSAFYKNFQNPIERTVDPLSSDQNIRLIYNNVPNAQVYGLEFEVRKKLNFISEALSNFRVGTNVTLLRSQVDIAAGELALIRANDPDAEDTRALYNQSPFIINSNLTYQNEKRQFTVNLAHNVFGERLAVVGISGTPNVFEQPRNILDLSITKGLGSRWSTRISAQNLLNPAWQFTQTDPSNDNEVIYQDYKVGRTFSASLTYLIN